MMSGRAKRSNPRSISLAVVVVERITALKTPSVPLATIAEEGESPASGEEVNVGMGISPPPTDEQMAKEVGADGRGMANTPVLSFDTSAPAMLADGLTMPSEVGLAPPPAAVAAPTPRARRSPGPLRVSNSPEGAPPAANAVVTVNKMG
jgi:hypothetical protein